MEAADDETIGEIHVRRPNLFLGYLNRPDATAEAIADVWFRGHLGPGRDLSSRPFPSPSLPKPAFLN